MDTLLRDDIRDELCLVGALGGGLCIAAIGPHLPPVAGWVAAVGLLVFLARRTRGWYALSVAVIVDLWADFALRTPARELHVDLTHVSVLLLALLLAGYVSEVSAIASADDRGWNR